MSPAQESRSRRRFSEIVSTLDEDIDLAEAALLIACEEYPELDVRSYLERLDAMAAAASRGAASGAEATIDALRRYLVEEQGFRGNGDDYYDPRNSFLNEVLDRRIGIPITLSTVYIEVARRMGLAVHGVALPGHFIIKAATAAGEVLLDPFHGGAPLSPEDCQARLDRIFAGRVRIQPPMLAACGRKQMLARMLRNLKEIYLKAADHVRALRSVELLLRIEPRSPEDLRHRGLLYAALDCYAMAVRDLESFVALVPASPEVDQALRWILDLRGKASRLN